MGIGDFRLGLGCQYQDFYRDVSNTESLENSASASRFKAHRLTPVDVVSSSN